MNAKEITKLNIQNFGYITGKSIKGKGLEILLEKEFYASIWLTNNEKKELESFKEKLGKINLDDYFVSNISFVQDKYYEFDKNSYSAYLASLQRYNIEELIKSDFKNVRHLTVSKKPTLVGHIAVANYNASLESQQELIEHLIEISNVKMYGELEEDEYDAIDECKEFSWQRDCYCEGDYKLEHGDSYYVEQERNCVYVNGKCNPHNNDVADDFWRSFDEGEWLKEIDKDNTVAVYHRKGKDWYIGYTLEMEEVEIAWKNEDYNYDIDEYESEMFYYMLYAPDNDKLSKITEVIKSMKKDFEDRSYIYNELEIDSYQDDWKYNDNVFDLELLDLVFNDRNEAKSWIMDTIDWKKPIELACMEVNTKLIQKHVTFNIDMSIEITEVDYFSNREPIVEKYNQLKVLKRLENRLNYKVVWSQISEQSNLESFAIKQDEDEYHFRLGELLDEDTNPLEFLENILEQINTRRIKRLSEEKLFEKASYVFVGVEDSYLAGNCKVGTRDFINRHHIDTGIIGGLRGDELLRLENSSFTKRAVMQALVQHGSLAS